MVSSRFAWLLTFLAGVAGIMFLAVAESNLLDGEYAWAALVAVLAAPGLVAARRAAHSPR